MSQPRSYRAHWRCGYQSTWAEGQTDAPCFRGRLMPLSGGYWPLLDLLFLARSPILSLLLLPVHKTNSLLKVAKNPLNHQSTFLIFHSAFIYLFVRFLFHFLFTALGPNPCFSSWLGQNRRLTLTILAIVNKGRDYSPFLTALLLSLILFLKAQSLSQRIVYDSTEEFTNWVATICWAHLKQEHPTAKLHIHYCNLTLLACFSKDIIQGWFPYHLQETCL